MKKTTLICMLIFSIFFSINNFAQSTALYDISFQSTWNSSDHGTLPSNAHWSNLVGTNHNGSVTFLAIGQPASPGIEDVAEIGDNSTFNSEVQAAINMGNAEQWFNEPFAPYAAISSATLSNITVSEDFPLVSLAAMIAPSPDWMIAVNSLNLWDTDMEKWKESFTVDLFPYDAGTEANTEAAGTIPGPADGGEGFNEARDDVNFVARHPGVVTNEDGLSSSVLSPEHKFDNPLAKVVITSTQ